MKFESVKSLTLAFLVGVSLLLTFGLWDYEYNSTALDNNPKKSVDIGGKAIDDVRKLIQPGEIKFHIGDEHYQPEKPAQQETYFLDTLYQDMSSWKLYDFQLVEKQNDFSKNFIHATITFPESIPVDLLPSLFRFTNFETEVPQSWSFNNITFTFNEKFKEMKLWFILDNQQQAVATVNNESKYNLVMNFISNEKNLQPLVLFEKGQEPIYIPANSEMLETHRTVERIETDNIVDALFPTIVDRAGNHFNDGIRTMELLDEGQSIRFINPSQTDTVSINKQQLLEWSMSNISDHQGWTDDYHLFNIDLTSNSIRYRMYYKGYPVFGDDSLTTIYQKWSSITQLYEYRRPLVNLNSDISKEKVELKSAEELISYLTTEFVKENKLEDIQDIKLGYRYYNKNEDTSFSVALEPSWYVQVNNEWKRIDFMPIEQEIGGAKDAMDAN